MHALVGGRKSFAHRRPDRADELLLLRIESAKEAPKLSRRCSLRAIRLELHRILQDFASGDSSEPPDIEAPQQRRMGRQRDQLDENAFAQRYETPACLPVTSPARSMADATSLAQLRQPGMPWIDL